ncbi:unnamed protein product [Symbiodinium natans]|uniref:Uncharacterized protein n=1 Tax=Symbiodinium natans TaxID=878477 RepID=A0A812IIK1_9DINO|nr:unnamed protein product [Symbiodinium natans]CAE7036260.1 unnamed protein product [Symbiodinium natans]
MALALKLVGCGVLLIALSSMQQSFVPAVSGKQEVPRPEINMARPTARVDGIEASAPSSSMMPLAFGLTLGLAMVLPQRAMAATGNEDVGVLLDRLFTKEALGAFGIAGLSWNSFYLLFGLSGIGVLGLAVLLTVFLPPPRTMADK